MEGVRENTNHAKTNHLVVYVVQQSSASSYFALVLSLQKNQYDRNGDI
jgi:hypothetical protein